MEQAMQLPQGSRVMQWLRDVWRALLEAEQRRAQARVLAELDARTLRDIGFEELAADQRRRGMLRAVASRIGMY